MAGCHCVKDFQVTSGIFSPEEGGCWTTVAPSATDPGPGLISVAATPIVRWASESVRPAAEKSTALERVEITHVIVRSGVARSAGSRTIIKNLKLIYAVDFNCISS